MGGNVERRLDGDLQGVLHEPDLAYIRGQEIRPRLLAQLAQARLDERQLLGNEILVRQAAPTPAGLR
jgi:hypothetical protein